MSKLISLLLSLGTLLGGISLQADGFRGHAKLFYGPRQDAFTVSSSPKLFGEFRVLGQRSYEQGGVTFDYAYALMWSEYDPADNRDALESETIKFRWKDLPSSVGRTPSGGWAWRQNLDRLSLSGATGRLDWHLGRQAVTFGVARVVSPTDRFRPYFYRALDQEYRTGVDALRLNYEVGETSEIDLGVVVDEKADSLEKHFFLRYRGVWKDYDYDLLVLSEAESERLGLTMNGGILGAGVWWDSSMVRPKNHDDKIYYAMSFGAEYMFLNEVYAFFEGHHDTSAASKVEDYELSSQRFAMTSFSSQFLARNYLSMGARKQIHPLIQLNSSMVLNMIDGSALYQILFDYNLFEDFYLGGGVNSSIDRVMGVGEQTDSKNSEFTRYPDSGYLAIRRYW